MKRNSGRLAPVPTNSPWFWDRGNHTPTECPGAVSNFTRAAVGVTLGHPPQQSAWPQNGVILGDAIDPPRPSSNCCHQSFGRRE